MNVEHETDISRVRVAARLALRENARLVEEIVRVKRENLELRGATPEQLQQELALLDEKLRRDAEELERRAAQPDAPLSAENASGTSSKKPRRRSGTREEQKTLRVVDLPVFDLDDADKTCTSCGGDLQHFEGHDDVTEEVDVIAREFVVHRKTRKKYRCKCGCIEQAMMPVRLVPGGRYSNAFAVEVAAMKYVDQLPLERQVKIFRREGLVIDSQTLWDQVHALSDALLPAWKHLREEILTASVIGIDQSPWKVLGHKKTQQMWTLSTKNLAYFDTTKTKGFDDGMDVLGDYAGIVVGDAATTHDKIARLTNITLAHCWAHPRRDAEKLRASDPLRAEAIIRFIKRLYEADESAGDDDDKLRAVRHEVSRKVLDELDTWCATQHALPSSPTAKVIGYLRNHRTGLRRFLDDVRIPLDNNQSERGYLWVAIGRRSFYGSRSDRGTRAAAIFYSLAESARRNGVDPKAYFTAALDDALASRPIRLPTEMA